MTHDYSTPPVRLHTTFRASYCSEARSTMMYGAGVVKGVDIATSFQPAQ